MLGIESGVGAKKKIFLFPRIQERQLSGTGEVCGFSTG